MRHLKGVLLSLFMSQLSICPCVSTADRVKLASHPQTVGLTQLFAVHSLFLLSPFSTQSVNHSYHSLASLPPWLFRECFLTLLSVSFWLTSSSSALHMSDLLLPSVVFSSGQKCLRHNAKVLDTQVLISPSQEQVHLEVSGQPLKYNQKEKWLLLFTRNKRC